MRDGAPHELVELLPLLTWREVLRDCQDGFAFIEVRDSGTGIPLEMQPTLFEMFSQVDRTLGRSEGGLGIALALVKNLVSSTAAASRSRVEA